jgi:hypothetical protein
VIDDRPKQFRSAIKARILSLDESLRQPAAGKMAIAALTFSGSSLVVGSSGSAAKQIQLKRKPEPIQPGLDHNGVGSRSLRDQR